MGDSNLDTGVLPPLGDSFLDTGVLPPLGDSFLDTGGLPFGGTHSWVQGDSPLGDSFLDTGELPFGGLIPVYRGTPLWGTLFLDTGGLPPWVTHSCGGESYMPDHVRTPSCPLRRHSSSSYPLRDSFLTSGGLIPAHSSSRPVNLRKGTYSCLTSFLPAYPEGPYSCPREFSSYPRT